MKDSNWISVEDRMPEETVKVIISQSLCSYVMIAAYSNGKWFESYEELEVVDGGWIDSEITEYSTLKVTHWMPLPEPPK